MASDYSAFDVLIDNYDGTTTAAVDAVIQVFDIEDADPADGSGAIALDDISADASGHVAAGSLDIDAGRKVRFSWFREEDGACGSATQVTS